MSVSEEAGKEARHDVVVIGSGQGGHVDAIRTAQVGFKSAAVEKVNVGGHCLNYAGMPANAGLHVADVMAEIPDAKGLWITVTDPTIDFDAVMAHLAKLVSTLADWVSGLFKKNQIDLIQGTGSLIGDGGALSLRATSRGDPDRHALEADGCRGG